MPYKVLAAEITMIVYAVFAALVNVKHTLFVDAAGGGDGISTNTAAISVLATGFTAMLGLMAWVLKRLLDTTIPQQQAAFVTAMDKAATAFTEGADKAATASASASEKQRDAFTTSLERQLKTFENAQANFQRIVEQIQASHKDDMDRERVFYRDLYHQKLQQLVEEERQDREKFLGAFETLIGRANDGGTQPQRATIRSGQ